MLTHEQNEKFLDAIGDGHHWPQYTDDPIVNSALDTYVNGHFNFGGILQLDMESWS